MAMIGVREICSDGGSGRGRDARMVGNAAWVRGDVSPASTTIAHLTLRRPEKKNALTPEMVGELLTAIVRLEAACANPKSAAFGAVLFSGMGGGREEAEGGAAGDRSNEGNGEETGKEDAGGDGGFCSGFDLKLCAADASGQVLRDLLTGLSRAIAALRRLPVPVVIAAHGKGGAVAGGCALLGGADVVIAADTLTLGYPVVRLGISPAVSAPFVTRAIGAGHARGLMLDPGLISAAEALRLGLVHEIVMEDPAHPGRATIARGRAVAFALAAKAAGGGGGMRATKAWMNELDGLEQGESGVSDSAPSIQRGLAVSLGLIGSAEERERLAALWGGAAR